jgi:phosphohistidine phosphatase SixA
MLQAILVRHAEKDGSGDDAPLSESGRESTSQLGSFLAKLGLRPALVLTSRFVHARETADGLAMKFPPTSPPILKVDALTPVPATRERFSIETMVDEAAVAGHCLTDNTTAIFVGHEPRLTQLATIMTRQRIPPLERLEAVCIEADTLSDLRVGRGRLCWRWRFPHPVVDSSRDELGPKLTGKMTIAGLFAGFTFTALLELVKEPDKLKLESLPGWSALHSVASLSQNEVFAMLSVAAIICLTISLGLFVLAIYVYDRLSMPQVYLESLPIPQVLARRSKAMRNRSRRFGFVYAAMIRTWQWVFTPAVVFALLGFLTITARAPFPTLFLGMSIVIVALLIYYYLESPGYSVD